MRYAAHGDVDHDPGYDCQYLKRFEGLPQLGAHDHHAGRDQKDEDGEIPEVAEPGRAES